ncbi:MAG: hypothetical protein R3A44_41925 [Caldilineaceae bacterium]
MQSGEMSAAGSAEFSYSLIKVLLRRNLLGTLLRAVGHPCATARANWSTVLMKMPMLLPSPFLWRPTVPV